MKKLMLLTITLVYSNMLLATTLFKEDFEGDLSNWVGKNAGLHNGIIVQDPIENDHALNFSALTGGGDIFSKVITNPLGSYILSFDYLGKKSSGSVDDNYGGFIGYSLGTPGNHVWLAGSQSDYSGLLAHLEDTEVWEHISIAFTGDTNIRVMIEDFSGSNGIVGDAYFDNILLTDADGETCSSTASSNTNTIVMLEDNKVFTLIESAKVFGANGNETLKIAGTPNTVIDSNIERIEFSKNLDNYSFILIGNILEIKNRHGVVANITTSDKFLRLVFKDGAINFNLAGLNDGIFSNGALTLSNNFDISNIITILDGSDKSNTILVNIGSIISQCQN